jgi:HPr kinase/phosphorylase
MQFHGSCASKGGLGVLLLGPPGSGKSDLVLRLRAHGFDLVADDRVDIVDGVARPPPALAGLLEVRGLGIFRLPHTAEVRLALVVDLSSRPPHLTPRLPMPEWHAALDLPLVWIDATAASAPERIALALDGAVGRVGQVAGVFAA